MSPGRRHLDGGTAGRRHRPGGSINDGTTIRLSGSQTKTFELPEEETVSADTIVEFTFSSGYEGQFIGFGFTTSSNWNVSRFIKLTGTKPVPSGHVIPELYDPSDDTVRYRIRMGDYYTAAQLETSYSNLFFANRRNVGPRDANTEAIFSNVRIYTDQSSTVDGLIQQTQFTYNSDNIRIKKSIQAAPDENGDSPSVEHYIHAGTDLSMVLNEDGSSGSRFVYAAEVDNLLFTEDFIGDTLTERKWAVTDQLGTVHSVLDDSATLLQHIDYDAFGNIVQVLVNADEDNNNFGDPLVDLGMLESQFAFAGREWDNDVGLYYNRARWYDGDTGRFISEDPIGFAGGDANLNRYAAGDPVNLRDPSGLFVDVMFTPGFEFASTSPSNDPFSGFLSAVAFIVGAAIESFSGNSGPRQSEVQSRVTRAEFDLALARGRREDTTFFQGAKRRTIDKEIASIEVKLRSLNEMIGSTYVPARVEHFSIVAGVGRGIYAGGVNVADVFTFNKIGALNAKRNEIFDDFGLTGTLADTVSTGGAVVARESLITVATLGTSTAIRGSSLALRASSAGNAVRSARVISTIRSPLTRALARTAANPNGIRALQATNVGLFGYESYQVAVSANSSISAFAEGDIRGGVFNAGIAGLSGLGVAASGSQLRRGLNSVNRSLVAPIRGPAATRGLADEIANAGLPSAASHFI